MTTGKMGILKRLTLLNAVIILAIQVTVSGAVYFFMKHQIETNFNDKLNAGFETISSILINSGGDIYDVYHISQSESFIILRDNKIAYETEAWKDNSLSDIAWPKGKRDKQPALPEHLENFQIKSGDIDEYGIHIKYGMDASSVKENLQTLATILVAAVPAGLIFVLAAGYFLARKALKPVTEITEKARLISAESLSERLPVTNKSDEIGQLAEVMNRMLARLEKSFDQLRRFTSDASHELRTPLTSIRSVGEVALKNNLDKEKYKETIGSMLEEVERISNLTDQLLTLARSDSGNSKLEFEEVELAYFVQGVVDELRVLAEEKKQILLFNNLDPGKVNLCQTTFRQALSNVIHNAIQYTPEGGKIDVKVSFPGDNSAVIDVIDNGPGIPKSEREKVFDRFYRLDKARSRESGGTGLGLSIAKWAVESHGGTIEFIVQDQDGALCKIRIPND